MIFPRQVRSGMIRARSCMRAKAKAAHSGLHHRLQYLGMGVTQDHWSPRLHVIEIAITILVVQVWATGAIDKDRFATHGAKRPHRTIDAAGQQLLRLSKEGL